MLLRAGAIGEAARALQHYLAPVLLVGQLGRIALGGDRDLLAVDHDGVLGRLDGPVEDAVHRVVLEQMSKGRRLVDVVDVDDVELGAALDGRTQDVAADAPEAVDRETSHETSRGVGLHRLRDPERQA